MSREISQLGSTSTGLMRRVKAGESQAWEELCATYSGWIYARLRRKGVPAADVADVAQAVLFGFSQIVATFNPESFRGWLARCIQCRAADYHRERLRRGEAEHVARGGSNFTQFLANLPAETSAEDSALSDATARLIGALGPDTQEAALALPEHALTHSASPAEHRAAEGPEVSEQLRRAQQVVAIVAKVRQRTKPHCWEAFWRVYMLKHETNEVAQDVGMTVGALHECLSRTRRRLRKELIAADPSFAKYLDAGKPPPSFTASLVYRLRRLPPPSFTAEP